ncbi:SRPBCC family protein [Sorangium sp. So ce1335]|uniref:SRPBCC family protein n=1 Tax=Sorangium sp. So ce1335 TaxID=3133335 RepID=UPI003F64137F
MTLAGTMAPGLAIEGSTTVISRLKNAACVAGIVGGSLLVAGCALEATAEETAEQSLALGCDCDVPTQSVITVTGPDRYRSEQQVLLDAPVGKVWAKLGSLERFFEIALPNATDLQWVVGNGKSVGDELNFILDGGLIRLLVVTRDHHEHRFEYRLIEPSLGIEELESTLTLRACGNRTELVWVRNFRMSEGVSFDPLSQVVAQEFANVIARFSP